MSQRYRYKDTDNRFGLCVGCCYWIDDKRLQKLLSPGITLSKTAFDIYFSFKYIVSQTLFLMPNRRTSQLATRKGSGKRSSRRFSDDEPAVEESDREETGPTINRIDGRPVVPLSFGSDNAPNSSRPYSEQTSLPQQFSSQGPGTSASLPLTTSSNLPALSSDLQQSSDATVSSIRLWLQ